MKTSWQFSDIYDSEADNKIHSFSIKTTWPFENLRLSPCWWFFNRWLRRKYLNFGMKYRWRAIFQKIRTIRNLKQRSQKSYFSQSLLYKNKVINRNREGRNETHGYGESWVSISSFFKISVKLRDSGISVFRDKDQIEKLLKKAKLCKCYTFDWDIDERR